MSSRLNLNGDVLVWAISKSDKDISEIEDKFPKIKEWISNEVKPTFKQVQSLSAYLKMPFGYLIVDHPPEEKIELLKFRTINSQEEENPSRELIDTINEMTVKQNWMRNYLIEEGYESNHIVNQLKSKENALNLAQKIRELIDLPINWFETYKTKPLNYLRDKLSYNGILMMQSGIAKNNTHRSLDPGEFRAFCLIDDYSPLIFINTKDTTNGKVFSIMHELAHIGLGIENIFNEEINSFENSYKKNEALCNKIAAELLVPNGYFTEKWKNHKLSNDKDKIYDLSGKFVSSTVVIARRALDNKFIKNDLYKEIVNESMEQLRFNSPAKKSGGNALNNAKSRLDTNFTIAISDGLKNGRALHSDIYRLTGLKSNMFDKVVKSLEGN